MGLTDLDNIFELTKRIWKQWNQDHLQGTILFLFVSIFAKWWFKPTTTTLYALLVLGVTLMGITAIKFIAEHLGNTQQFNKYMQEGQRAKDIAETHFQMDLSVKMADNLIVLYTTLVTTLEEVFEDDEVTPAEAAILFKTYRKTFHSMGTMLGKTSDGMKLAFKEFVDRHFRKPLEEDGLPNSDDPPGPSPSSSLVATEEETDGKSEMELLAESLETGNNEILAAQKVVDKITGLNPSGEELSEDTDHLQ